MTLEDARRGYPGYRSPSARVPQRTDARTTMSRGFRISFDDVGAGPPVVLVQGFTLSGGDWWELGYVDRVVGFGRRVLVVDPLGHGQSDRPHDPASYRWPGVALDIAAAMDAADVDRAVLWGYSRGASLVASLAAERPDRVDAVILGGAAGLETDPPNELAGWLKEMLAGDWAAYWSTPLGAGYTEADRRYCEAVNDPRALAAALAGRRIYPYHTDLESISAPVLLYEGGEDDPDNGAVTAALLGAEHRILAGLDHDGALAGIDVVVPIVEPFLSAHASPS